MNIQPFLKKAPHLLEFLDPSVYVGVFQFSDGDRDIALFSIYHDSVEIISQINFSKNSSYAKHKMGGYTIDGVISTNELLKAVNVNDIKWRPLSKKAAEQKCLGMAITLCKGLRGIPELHLGLLVYREQQDERVLLEMLCSINGVTIEDIEIYGNLDMQPQGYVALTY